MDELENSIKVPILCITCGDPADIVEKSVAYGPPTCYACGVQEEITELEGISQYLADFDD